MEKEQPPLYPEEVIMKWANQALIVRKNGYSALRFLHDEIIIKRKDLELFTLVDERFVEAQIEDRKLHPDE